MSDDTELALALLRADGVDDVLRVVARWGAERLGFGTAVAYVREPGARGLVARTGYPAAAIEAAAEELSLRGLGADATRVLTEERVPLVIPDVAGDERTAGTGLRTRGVRSVLAVPLLHGGEVVGVLLFARMRRSHPCGPEHVQAATAIATLAAEALVRARTASRDAARTETLGRQNGLLRHATAVDQRLARIALAGGGVRGLVAAVGELTGKPAVLYDVAGHRPAEQPHDDVRVRLLEHRDARVEVRELLDGAAADSCVQVPAMLPLRLRHRHLVAPVQVEDERWGWLVVAEHPSRLTARDELTLRRAAAHVALELTSQRRAAGASWDARSTLARYLIRGSHDALEVTQAAEYLGVAVGAPRVVAFVTEPGGPGGPVDVERLVAAMGRHGAGDTLVTRGPEGAALLVEVAPDDPASVAVGRVKRAVAAACDEVGGDGTIAGLSTVCRDPRAMPRAYREARESAHCVQGFAPRGRHRVLAADDLGPARIFVANGDTVAIDRFVDDTLGPLLGADEGVRDLVRTLGVFFELDRNVRGSAAELGIHENTIRYRLARVRSATGLDVAADANDQLTVQTALLVLRLRGHDALPPFRTGAERADGVEMVPAGTGA